MISRDADGLKAAANAISALQERVEGSSSPFGLASAAATTAAPALTSALKSEPMLGFAAAVAPAFKPDPTRGSAPATASERAATAAPMASSDAASIAATMRIRLQLETASATVAAMLARKESCGSHYRSDAVQ